MFKKGNHKTYEASISGGTDKFKYYSSISYLKQEGIAINSGLERISGRLNVDYQATDKLKLGANMFLLPLIKMYMVKVPPTLLLSIHHVTLLSPHIRHK